ncbi:hypothetical protein FSARC_8450 [Fusarium sarcochroum]|uniref:Uncharacterized protein n=1 Tax=Fusarium sarcochroum TaxID=1208366 RepID=A0A8H4X6Y2_9HYPO|nr:hypothetical protein FSARC_8450 [Fusarium sarcochroum]
MGVQATFCVSVKDAKDWYNENEAQKVLDDAVASIQDWKVFSDLETWPEPLDMSIARIGAVEQKATVYNYDGSEAEAYHEMRRKFQKFSVKM